MIATKNLDNLIQDMEQLAELPDAVVEEMLMAAGKIIAEGQKQEVAAQGLVDTGTLRDSITVNQKMRRKGDTRYVTVYPKGIHHTAKRKDGSVVNVMNGEVFFIHHYGAPKRNIRATRLVDTANEKSADKAVEAAAAIYDKYLESKNL